ncbi:TIGR04283 family arsenosugar biosynthesis glycosyltransferase [Psychrobacter sp. TAE2020]|uniref:TIGR04283 family arsenosugar biosynthesis glycosyltransferase n=1 Tax=Psychrobacter sp. TAE2020 TaxID=2846762 RepID=UPI001C119B47|nr:TIGR04283 family arsenosugar biosynthesis glycosyltransferase [Psychrobacter sp. TAE2020]MBU5617950.1 TIGR04283 family arsenosugar biosynthesis glycosyltransferase [Psychrobacter sp. TAE2020]
MLIKKSWRCFAVLPPSVAKGIARVNKNSVTAQGSSSQINSSAVEASWVSIIIPILNEADNLPRLFNNITSLKPLAQQVLLVDGGSTDQSLSVAERFIKQHNQQLANKDSTTEWQIIDSAAGRAMQMNTGAEQATGNILLFLHADTQLPEDAISHIKQVLDQANSNYKWGRFDVRLNSDQPVLWLVSAMMNARSRLTGIATGDQAIFITKSLFGQIGGYPQQPLMEDIQLCKNLKGIAKPACLTSRVTTSARRWQQHGTWRTILLMWHLRFDYWRGVSAEEIKQRYYKN